MLTLALFKGRILEDTAGLLAQYSIHLDSSAVDSRQLILPTDDPEFPQARDPAGTPVRRPRRLVALRFCFDLGSDASCTRSH